MLVVILLLVRILVVSLRQIASVWLMGLVLLLIFLAVVKWLVALLNIWQVCLRVLLMRLVLAIIGLIFLLELLIQSELRALIRLWMERWQNLLWRIAPTATSIRRVEGLLVLSLGRLELALAISSTATTQ